MLYETKNRAISCFPANCIICVPACPLKKLPIFLLQTYVFFAKYKKCFLQKTQMHPMCILQKTHRGVAVGFQMAAHEVVRTPCLGLDVGSSEKLHHFGAVSLYGKNRLDRLWNYSFRRIDVISSNVCLFFGYIFIGVSKYSSESFSLND